MLQTLTTSVCWKQQICKPHAQDSSSRKHKKTCKTESQCNKTSEARNNEDVFPGFFRLTIHYLVSFLKWMMLDAASLLPIISSHLPGRFFLEWGAIRDFHGQHGIETRLSDTRMSQEVSKWSEVGYNSSISHL